MNRTEIEERVTNALKAVDLQGFASRKPHLLSGGEKRRLAIAGILAMKPRLLVLDEPFSNLDYPGSLKLLAQLVTLHGQGHSIVVVTHELEKIVAHIDRLVLMYKGCIVRDGSPENLMVEVERYGVRQPVSFRYAEKFESWLK